MTFPRVCSPDDYSERLIALTDEICAARLRAHLEVKKRDDLIAELGKHLNCADGEQVVAVVGDHIFQVGRRGETYAATVMRIHARA